MTSVNIWPILVASIVAFGIGALWYSPVLFGREWMSLMNINASDVDAARAKGMWKLYIVQFIFTVITFGVLGFVVAATGGRTTGDGALLGLLAWVGFVLPTGVSGLLWEKRSFRLVLINTLSVLLNLVIGGAIIGAWS